uniref:Glutathione peroxidase 3 n=1 Tax=Gouania willdenowi TaxID=441366 RepID=A0A8C5NEZ5_GOUWI
VEKHSFNGSGIYFFSIGFITHSLSLSQNCDSSSENTIYKYQARTLNYSRLVNFSDYKGKSVLFVNVATY